MSGPIARSADRFFGPPATEHDTKVNSFQTRTFKQQLMISFELYVLRAAPSDFFAPTDPADLAEYVLIKMAPFFMA